MKRKKGNKNETIKEILYNNKYDTEVVRKISRTNNEQEQNGGKKNEDGQNLYMSEHKQS